MRWPITVHDDIGTRYRAERAAAGGSGTEWDLDRTFTPGAPLAAHVIKVTAEGGRPVAIEVSTAE